MGSAIAERLKAKYQVFVFEKDSAKTKDLSGIEACASIADLMGRVDTVILAVKPQDFDPVLSEIKNPLKDKLIISIAAGVSTEYLEKILGQVKSVRVMPNMPAKIGMGMTCLCKGKFATDEDLNFAKEIFDNLGQTLIIEEDMMDAATAISGSGPGFLFYSREDKNLEEFKDFAQNVFMPSLTASAEKNGFSHEQAVLLVTATTQGSIVYLEKSNLLPSELIKQVASKGGTTEAGLKVLFVGGSLEDAVKEARKRAEELSKKG